MEPARTAITDHDDIHDANAFAAAFQRCRKGAVGACIHRGSGAFAEDAYQDVFLRLWLEPHRWDPTRGPLQTYVSIATRGRSLDSARSESARRRREVIDTTRQGDDPDGMDHEFELRRRAEALRR